MKLNFPRVLLSVLILAVPAFGSSVDLPNRGLESRIDFWKKVFTQYGENDNILHDRYHVNLIYDVVDDGEKESRVRTIQAALNEIRSKLAEPETFSPIAQQIHDAINANGLTPNDALLRQLADNVHSQRGIKERFRSGVVRSGRYVDQFTKIFESHGLPSQLALLPLVESSFTNARSKVGAAGIWQFMRSTGRTYKLRVTNRIDDRLDPVKATTAAARLLRDNYASLGAWPLAITAYNHGRGGMLRAQGEHGDDISTIIEKYDGKTFGYASMNFYAEFLAAVEVYENYPQYFGELVLDKPNAPAAKAVAVASSTPKAPAQTAADKYRVRRGDTLTKVAQRFGTTIQELMARNNLKKSAIYVGQILLVN